MSTEGPEGKLRRLVGGSQVANCTPTTSKLPDSLPGAASTLRILYVVLRCILRFRVSANAR